MKCTRKIGNTPCANDMVEKGGRCEFHLEMETGEPKKAVVLGERSLNETAALLMAMDHARRKNIS